jgi:ABC-type lipoprotein export system ATPase subunit/GNAT superfamily N-acetyltransferase
VNTLTLTTDITRSPRVMQIEGMFDIEATARATTTIPLALPDLSERDWNVGLIVGPSGAGKSTVARHLFPVEMTAVDDMTWRSDAAVVDEFPSDMKVQAVTELLSSVGFSSPPAWLRPFDTLSNGEQFRVSIARLLAEKPDLAVVDEFTSVVDRTVAKVGSHAIAKTVRKRGQRFVAVGCHYDVEDWLQPDWVYQPHVGTFAWRSVQSRPRLDVEIIRSDHSAWAGFARHHYLDHTVHRAADIYVGLIEGQPAVLCALMHLVHGKVRNAKRVSRIVTLPDFQGIGVAGHMLDAVGGALRSQGTGLYITTSHPAMIRALHGRSTWNMNRKPSRVAKQGNTSTIKGKMDSSRSRLTASFRYIGPADDRLVGVVVGAKGAA